MPGIVKKFSERQKRADEDIVAWAQGYLDPSLNGALVITSQRVAFYGKFLMTEKVESIPLAKVSSVQVKRGLISGKLTIHTTGNSMEFTAHLGSELPPLQALLEQHMAGLTAPPPPETEPPPDIADQLGRLADLHRQGVLTTEEFTTAKARLLAG